MRKFKVGMITSSYPRNRNDFAGVFVRSLAEHIAELGHEVHMLAAFDPDLRPNHTLSKVKTHYFRYALSKSMHVVGYGRSLESDVKLKKLAFAMAPSYVISAALYLAVLAVREKFDIIHAHWVLPTGPIAAFVSKLLSIPLIVSLHGSDVYMLDKNRLFRDIGVSSLNAAKVVTACSEDLKNRTVSAGVPADKVQVVPYGVDIEAFDRNRLDSSLISDVRQNALGSDGTFLVLCLGRLVQKKGFEYLIEAAPEVIRRHSGARFIVAGEGDERDKLRQLVRDLRIEEQVLFPGAVAWQMIPYFYAAADVVVVPSVRDSGGNVDGLPNVLLEAMATGKPVVASNIAGIPLVVRDGSDGLLVSEKSPHDIADALERYLASANLRGVMGGNARKRILESFSWTGVAKRVEILYEESISG